MDDSERWGGPTPDKPTVTLSVPDPNHISSFMNFRVADIQACYKLWKSLSLVFLFWGRALVSSIGNAERMISMKSEIKIGQQFEFAIRADKELRQKAVVTRVLSDREEGLGPEVDYYIADWIEARTLSERPKALVFVLANDGSVYLDGERVDIIVDRAA